MTPAHRSWLSGPPNAGYPGERLGLPPAGPGSIAGLGVRLAAFSIDCVASWLVATLITRSAYTGLWSSAVFLAEVVMLESLTGQSFGKAVVGLRVVRINGRPSNAIWILVRTILLFLFVPALIWDRDGRALHDKAAGTVVVRARR
jgi:uncharacterized RDD family membrane protein YckC